MKQDKVYHFLAGSLIAAFGLWFSTPGIALALVAAAAISKEVWDRLHDGFFDYADLLATIVGGAVVVIAWS